MPTPATTAKLTTPELESELLGLAGQLAAAQCRFLGLLVEFDRRGGWSGPGLRSCAHWLCWRAGMSLRTAAEHVRVAHALTELPAITAAFAQGRISYSKVRAITRIATADTEHTLLQLALAGTASHVETVVRAARRHGADPTQAVDRRSLSWYWDDDGSLVLRGRLPAADGAALIAALAAQPVPEPDDPTDPHTTDADPISARRADALAALVAGTREPALVVVHLDLGTGDAAIADGPEIPAPVGERLACDAQVQLLLNDRRTNQAYLGRRHRLASPAQIAALTVRDQHRCQFPGCTHTRHLHAHHVRHWLHGGPTDIDNLVLICTFHHMLIHDHGYRIGYRDGRWHTVEPDGTPVPATGAPLAGTVTALTADNPDSITPDGLTPTWGGERLDPTAILDRLLPPVPAAA